MRDCWQVAAANLDLDFSKGKNLYADKITGTLEGYPIAIYNEFNFDVQRLVTLIWVGSKGAVPSSTNLSRQQLLVEYDNSLEKSGAVPVAFLSEEERAWFLGHRYGVGTEMVAGDLIYRQHYGMTSAEEIVLVAKAMVLTIRQLAWQN